MMEPWEGWEGYPTRKAAQAAWSDSAPGRNDHCRIVQEAGRWWIEVEAGWSWRRVGIDPHGVNRRGRVLRPHHGEAGAPSLISPPSLHFSKG